MKINRHLDDLENDAVIFITHVRIEEDFWKISDRIWNVRFVD